MTYWVLGVLGIVTFSGLFFLQDLNLTDLAYCISMNANLIIHIFAVPFYSPDSFLSTANISRD
jgi:hypothetical protein